MENKSCPFCGSTKVYRFVGRRNDMDESTYVWIECGECCARGPTVTLGEQSKSEQTAAENAWNNRGNKYDIQAGDWVQVQLYKLHGGLKFRVGAVEKENGELFCYSGILRFNSKDLDLLEPPISSW